MLIKSGLNTQRGNGKNPDTGSANNGSVIRKGNGYALYEDHGDGMTGEYNGDGGSFYSWLYRFKDIRC
jgi:hypothetical protein